METNYEKSNRIRHTEMGFSECTKQKYNRFRNMPDISQSHLQDLADCILSRFNLSRVCISFAGIQPFETYKNGRLKKKSLGRYTWWSTGSKIQVFRLTAKRRKQITPKVAINTLLHEIQHHFDMVLYGLSSIHSGGFYRRIGQLQDALVGMN